MFNFSHGKYTFTTKKKTTMLKLKMLNNEDKKFQNKQLKINKFNFFEHNIATKLTKSHSKFTKTFPEI